MNWYGLTRKYNEHWKHDRKVYDDKRKEYFSSGKGGAFRNFDMTHRDKISDVRHG